MPFTVKYIITGSLYSLSTGTLTSQPHPTIFHEEYETKFQGNGQRSALGYPWTEWTWANLILDSDQWGELMAFVGTAPSATVWIRTRTNQTSGGEYVYANYQAIMHRPAGNSRPDYRFDNVSVKFTRLVAA